MVLLYILGDSKVILGVNDLMQTSSCNLL